MGVTSVRRETLAAVSASSKTCASTKTKLFKISLKVKINLAALCARKNEQENYSAPAKVGKK